MSVRQYVISDPPNIIYKQTQNDTTGKPSTVWQQQMDNARMETQYIIHSDHPYLYRRNSNHNDSETQFRPLQTIEDYNLSITTPSMAKIRTGTMSYTTRVTYSFALKIILQQMTRMTLQYQTIHCPEPSLIFGSRTLRQRYQK